ncbi:MAG: HoxN/HupN/NixA family nickel/cobalt transporter [Candidatus Bathyarchaeia archaeon]|jgi:high-affinity nickel-transport protein
MAQENEKCDRLGLTLKEKAKIAAIYVSLAAVTAVLILVSTIIGYKYAILAGLGMVSYVLGLRHAVDADHIAAIDNTTRKLLQQGKRPVTVGMWFSLGHSTVVIALTAALVLATRAVVNAVPVFESGGAVIGTSISGLFLFIIGLVNVLIVLDVYRTFKGLKEGRLNQAQLDDALNNNSFMSKTFGKLFKIVNEPWQIYPVGVLFGLGFDTATQIALIAISIGVSGSVPFWYVLIMPLLFTAGMVTIDSSDGISMRCAYGWAFLKPIRKIYYNLTITIISVLVAFAVGGIELLQVVASEVGLTSGFWGWLGNLDFETMGYAIVAIFLVSWLVAMAYYRYKGYEKTTLPRNAPIASGAPV